MHQTINELKNQIKFLEDLKHFLTQGTNNAQKIFNLLANELQKLLKIKWLLNEGYKIEKIANLLKTCVVGSQQN